MHKDRRCEAENCRVKGRRDKSSRGNSRRENSWEKGCARAGLSGLVLLLALLTALLSCVSCSSLYTAERIQLMKTEGEVDIEDRRGKEREPVPEMKLYSGYQVATKKESYAWIDLDSVKLAKLDMESQISVDKKRNGLEVIVDSGNLYFNIKEPLREDETLDIRTSNMAVGIRGTCGWVEVTDQEHMRVYILEGTVQCTVDAPRSREHEEATVSGGQMAELTIDLEAEKGQMCKAQVSTFSEEDIDQFVWEELEEDEALCGKIKEASGLDILDPPADRSPKERDPAAIRRTGPGETLAPGWSFGGVIMEDRSLWMWGRGIWGLNTSGMREGSATPIKVMEDMASVCANVVTGIHGDVPTSMTAAIGLDGSLWTWGDGILGDGLYSWERGNGDPVKVMEDVASVSMGEYTIAAVKTDGSLWMWGQDYNGEETGWETQVSPTWVMDDVAAVSICARTVAAVKTDGSLWMWGDNENGRLGNGSSVYSSQPVKVLDDVAAVSVSETHTGAIKTDGSLWMWGSNEYGQLGNGSQGNETSPSYVVERYDNGQRLYDWGYPIQTVPVKVLDHVTAISTGKYNTAAILEDGSLWTWGTDFLDETGSGNKSVSRILRSVDDAWEIQAVIQDVPTKVMEDVAAVNCNGDGTMAVKKDGSLWMWGPCCSPVSGDGRLTGPTKMMDGVAVP